MYAYLARRLVYMGVTVVLVSMIGFTIIQLPPGDYLTTYIANLQSLGTQVTESEAASLRAQYGLDRTAVEQYLLWVRNMVGGDFGYSFEYRQPVGDLIAERLPATVVISGLAILFTYALAIPIGIFSATHQYSLADYLVSFIGFIGLAIPDFLLALVLMWFLFSNFGLSVGGLLSPEYLTAPWSIDRVIDLLKHLPLPILVIGLAGTASLIRVMRGMLLDELRKPYVIAARTRGLSEYHLTLKYPSRLAILPLISAIGWLLPSLVSGTTIISIVLDLPTVGALLYRSLIGQDMFLAGTSMMLLTVMTVVGMLISDLFLVWLDPRIRLE